MEEVAWGTLGHLRAAARFTLSCLLTLALSLGIAVPAVWGGVRVIAQHLARLALDSLVQAFWGYLAGLPPAAGDLLPPLPWVTPNSTDADEPAAFLHEALAELGEVRVAGSTWTWVCLALTAGRRLRRG